MRNCGALRAEQSIPTFRFTPLGMTTLSTDRRSARSHCEKSGRSGGARGFSPCLTFWYFWVKPKVHIMLFLSKKEPKKTATDARSAGRDRLRAMPRQKEETERSEGKAKKSGNRRRSRLKRYADKLAPALLNGASAVGSASRFFAMRSRWCAACKYTPKTAFSYRQ